MRKLRDVLFYLFFPPRCCACGQLMQRNILDIEPGAFCESCERKWMLSKLENCEKCGLEATSCRCMPRTLRASGAASVLHLVSYSTADSVGKRGILYLKRHNNKRVIRFFAREMSFVLREYLESTYTSGESVLLSFVPRSLGNERRYGFDQSELICRELANEIRGKEFRLLARKRSMSDEQKKLESRERIENAEQMFSLSKVDFALLDRKYRCIVLVDDVMTTGASLGAATKLLSEKFHGRIVCLTIGKTVKEKGK